MVRTGRTFRTTITLIGAVMALAGCASKTEPVVNNPPVVEPVSTQPALSLDGIWRIEAGACTGTLLVLQALTESQYAGEIHANCGKKDTVAQTVSILVAAPVVSIVPVQSKATSKTWPKAPLSLVVAEGGILHGQAMIGKKNTTVFVSRQPAS